MDFPLVLTKYTLFHHIKLKIGPNLLSRSFSCICGGNFCNCSDFPRSWVAWVACCCMTVYHRPPPQRYLENCSALQFSRCGVTLETVLLHSGALPSERYYSTLEHYLLEGTAPLWSTTFQKVVLPQFHYNHVVQGGC